MAPATLLRPAKNDTPDRTAHEPWLWALGSALIVSLALARRPLVALLAAALSGGLVYEAIRHRAAPSREIGQVPGPNGANWRSEEASWESFPASDPPATY
jgi:uncharacterized membrane protein